MRHLEVLDLRSILQLCAMEAKLTPLPATRWHSNLFFNEVSIFQSNLTKCINCISPLHHMANTSCKVCCCFFAPPCFISAYCERLSHLSIQQAPLKMEALKPMKLKPNFSTGFTGWTSRLVWEHSYQSCDNIPIGLVLCHFYVTIKVVYQMALAKTIYFSIVISATWSLLQSSATIRTLMLVKLCERFT